MKSKSNIWLAVALMVVFAITRWPGMLPLNFSAAYALAFCAGVYFAGSMGWWVPMLTLLATDIIMNVFYYHVSPLGGYMLVNYAAFAVLVLLGKKIGSQASFAKLLGGGLLGTVLFYLITNTFSWMENPQYQKTLAGLITALTKGTDGWPHTWEFFRNTLLSSGLFTSLFVGTMKYSESVAESAQEKEPVEEAEPAEASETPEESNAKA